MRNLTLVIHLHEAKPARHSDEQYGLTFHNNRQDDLGVGPLLCMHVSKPGRTQRVFTVWPTGIQLGRHVLRLGFICEGGNAVDDTASKHWHPGPRQAAYDHFHGLFGPRWPVMVDGVLGYFTVSKSRNLQGRGICTEEEAEAADVPLDEHVEFKFGNVPGPEQCPDCGRTIRTWQDHEDCKLIPKLLIDLGVQVHQDAPSGKPIARAVWGRRYDLTYSQALALSRTEPDSEARLREDMLAAWGTEVSSEVEEWMARAGRLGLEWPAFSEKLQRAAHAPGGPLHRNGGMNPEPPETIEDRVFVALADEVKADPDDAVPPTVAQDIMDADVSRYEKQNGGTARARLKVLLTSYFGVKYAYGSWLAERCGGKRVVEELTAREAEKAYADLTAWSKGRTRIGGIPAKYTRAELDALNNEALSVLFMEEFPGHEMDGSRQHMIARLLTVNTRNVSGV